MIPLFKVQTNPDIGAAVQSCFDRGVVADGSIALGFEKALATQLTRVQPDQVVSTNSCNSALHLAYDLCGVRPGTTVVATPMTCLAGLLPVVHLGGKILWADIDPLTGNILYESAKRAKDHNTRTVYGVLWGGDPVDPRLATLGVPFIQDAAHGLLSYFKNSLDPVACLRNTWTCFSFGVVAHLSTGDGGALVAPNVNMAACARQLRRYGFDRTLQGRARATQDIDLAGYKFHMNDVTAAIGLTQLPGAVESVMASQANAMRLDQALGSAKLKHVIRVNRGCYGMSSSWLYTLLTYHRDALQEHLASWGVASDLVHVRCDRYGLFDDPAIASQRSYLPGVDRFDAMHLCIPCGWWVTETDIRETIIPALVAFDQKISVDLPESPPLLVTDK